MARKKANTMVVNTLNDMITLVNHNTRITDRSIEKLKKSNRRTKFFCVIAMTSLVYMAAEYRRQEEELYKLNVRINKLEHKEGE